MSTQADPTQQGDPVIGTATTPVVDPPPSTVGNGKNIVMPSTAFKNRLSAATERGKRAAASEFEAQAKALGFSTTAEMFEAIAKTRQQAAAAPPAPAPRQPQPQPREDRRPVMPKNNGQHARERDPQRDQRRAEQERQRLEAERKARIRAEKLRREADRKREDSEVKHSMREAVIQNGVSDVDYGAFLLDQYVSGKTAEELEKFDEKKFFEELRSSRPYLFGEVKVPATTGTGPGNPPAPKPGAAIADSIANGKADLKKMNGVQYREFLAKRGLSLDDTGQ